MIMSKKILTHLLLAGTVFLAGCGTTGPLYIPEQRYPQKTQEETPNAPEAASANQTTTE